MMSYDGMYIDVSDEADELLSSVTEKAWSAML